MTAGEVGVGGGVISADFETLPLAVRRWQESVPNLGPMPEHIDTSKYPLDPATDALFSGTASWGRLGGLWPGFIEMDANAFVAWVDNTSKAFNISDQSNADQISQIHRADAGMRPV